MRAPYIIDQEGYYAATEGGEYPIGPVLMVVLARNSTGSVIVVGGTVLVLVIAVTTNVIVPVLVALGLLWLIATGFLLFGRPRRRTAR